MARRDSRRDLQEAGDRFKAARTELDDAKAALQPLMIAALKAKMPQKDVIELSGYTRESVRTLARRNGIDS